MWPCLLRQIDAAVSCSILAHLKIEFFSIFFIFFWRAGVCWPLFCCFAYVAHKRFLKGCLNSNSEYCRSKRAQNQLSHSSRKKSIETMQLHLIRKLVTTHGDPVKQNGDKVISSYSRVCLTANPKNRIRIQRRAVSRLLTTK